MKHLRGQRGLVHRPATVSLVLLLALGASAPLAGCAGDPEVNSGNEQVGSLGLNLEVAPGVTLLSVGYTITGNGFTKTGTIDVTDSPSISGTIGGIPAGNGYTLALSATSVEDETTFTGSANFNVTAGQTTAVSVHLKGTQGGATGSVSVIGTINVGPVIDDFTVTPLTVLTSGDVTLSVGATDVDSGPSPLSYAWSTTNGVLDDPTAPVTKLTSVTPGTVTVTVSVSDGELTSTRTGTVTFVSAEGGVGSGGATAGSGGATSSSGGATSTGGALGSGGETSSGGVTGSGGALGSGGETSSGGASGTGGAGAEEVGPLALITTAIAPNTAGVTSTVIQIPPGVAPEDTAVVFVLSTGNSAVVASPAGFSTTALAAAQHSLSFGKVGDHTSLTWTSATATTTGATAFFFHGASIAVEALGTSQPSGTSFGLDSSTQAPQSGFASGYALFAIQLPVANTPTVTSGPAGAWLGPVTDGKQLFSWGQPYVPGQSGFLFPSSLGGTLSASAVKRQARVFVSSPAE